MDKNMLVATLLDPAYKGQFFKDVIIFERAKDMLLVEVEKVALSTIEVSIIYAINNFRNEFYRWNRKRKTKI